MGSEAIESHTIISDGCSDLLTTQGESSPQRESAPERWLEWEAENNPGFQLKGVSGTRFRESNLERERSKDRTRRRVPGAPGGFRTLRAEGSGALEASTLWGLQPVGGL